MTLQQIKMESGLTEMTRWNKRRCSPQWTLHPTTYLIGSHFTCKADDPFGYHFHPESRRIKVTVNKHIPILTFIEHDAILWPMIYISRKNDGSRKKTRGRKKSEELQPNEGKRWSITSVSGLSVPGYTLMLDTSRARWSAGLQPSTARRLPNPT